MQLPVLVSCEHAGNRVPASFRRMISVWGGRLDTHEGWDIGIRPVAAALAGRFQAPAIYNDISRLVIDVNRSLTSPTLFSREMKHAAPELKRTARATIYEPYRDRLHHMVSTTIDRQGFCIHLSIHSFTPVWKGRKRPMSAGLLFDPRDEEAVTLANAWRPSLRAALDGLVYFNRPYRGTSDGVTRWLYRTFPAGVYVPLELEVRQDLLTPERRGRTAAWIARSCSPLISAISAL